MVLTGRDVRLLLQTGRLRIEPLKDEQIQQNGVDLILEEIGGKPPYFTPGRFYLGSTRETFALPDDLMAFVALRSTWARRGLIMPPTIVDAGFEGNLTLEIFFAGLPGEDSPRRSPLDIPYGERFAHLIFTRTTGPADLYRGKYFGQSGITPARED